MQAFKKYAQEVAASGTGGKYSAMQKKMTANQLKMIQPHQFWDEQPVFKLFDDKPKNDGPIIQ